MYAIPTGCQNLTYLKWTEDIIYNNLQNQSWIKCTLAKVTLLQIPYYNKLVAEIVTECRTQNGK